MGIVGIHQGSEIGRSAPFGLHAGNGMFFFRGDMDERFQPIQGVYAVLKLFHPFFHDRLLSIFNIEPLGFKIRLKFLNLQPFFFELQAFIKTPNIFQFVLMLSQIKTAIGKNSIDSSPMPILLLSILKPFLKNRLGDYRGCRALLA
jgi:hypothetical protein